ncbi:MAG: hypothetical protein J1E95_10080 [Muribaculaceae bacterium]|nr:hypothetical protein [Muribaculaceae bacterium]
MKKILSIFSALAFAAAGSTAMAGSMDKASLVSPEGEYVTSIYNIAVAWNWNPTAWKGTEIEIAMAPAQVTLECELGTFTFSNLADGIPKVQNNDQQLTFALYEVPGLKDLEYYNMKGEIKVTYPYGIVQSKDDYEYNEEVTFTINVMDYMRSYTSATPEPGTLTTDEIKDAEITLVYGDYTNLVKVESAGDVRVNIETIVDPWTSEYYDDYTIPWSDVKVEGNVVSFNLIGEVPDNHKVIVNLPVNSLIADETAVGGSANLTYKVWDGLPELTTLSAPDGTVNRENIPKLRVTWNYETIKPGEDGFYMMLYGYVSGQGESEGPVYPEYSFESVKGENDVLVVDFTSLFDELPKMSTYYFYFPMGVIQNEKGQVNEVTTKYQTCKFLPADPFDGPTVSYLEQDNKIIFYYDYAEAPEVYDGSFERNTQAASPYIINENGEQESVYLTDDIFTINGNLGYYYYFDLDREFPNGAISLVIPFAYFTVQTVGFNNVLEKQYLTELEIPLNKTTGVEMSIEDENAPIEYYNIQGQRVVNPQNGQLVIKRQGNKVQKIIVR